MIEKRYYVYIATNHPRHTVLYVGVTRSLLKREFEHKNKKYPNAFTAKYNVDKIVYYEIWGEPGRAIFREKQIKNLVRRKKIELIDSLNSKWNDLLENI